MPNFIPVDFDPFLEGNEIKKLLYTNEPQREIWLACAIGGQDANKSYNESVSLKLTGNLDSKALYKAVKDVVNRHEALRATISPNGENLIVYHDIPVELISKDITLLDPQSRINEFQSFLKKELNTSFHLINGPLFRFFLHKTDQNEHYFTLVIHHIISDGWSIGLILEDLSKCYNSYIRNEIPNLSPAFQLSDYVEAQENFKADKHFIETENFWLNVYKENVPVLDMPTDRPRRSPRSYKGNRIDQVLSKEKIEQLKTLGAKSGTSLVTTLLAAFEVFLYKTVKQQDIVVGLPASGQAATGMHDVIGHCVNLLPLRTYIDPSVSFSNYLLKRKTEVLDAYDHQRLTFGELIKKLYIPRDASRIPLVPVTFNVDKGLDSAVVFEGLQHKLISNPRSYENFELFLNATGNDTEMILEWSYNTDLFDSDTIEKYGWEYSALLDEIISNPDERIATITGFEGLPLSIALGKKITIPAEQNIITLFENAVSLYPDKTAITFSNTSYTYQQLAEKVNQLSHVLQEKNVVKGNVVALLVDRSIEMVVSMLAALNIGAAYLALDPEYPRQRIEFMLKDSNAELLVLSEKNKQHYDIETKILAIEDVWNTLSSVPNNKFQSDLAHEDLAYLLYTSGSTGNPKGVKITHLNLANFLKGMSENPGIKSTDILLAVTSVSFDIAGLELYLPLISGSELVVASADTTKDGRLLLDCLKQKDISIMQATPSTWQMLIDAGWKEKYPIKMLCGGEGLPADLADKLLQVGKELWNMYGPTETTIWSTVKQILPSDNQITIGTPIANTQVYIMDESGMPLPIGQTGEMYIGGTGVANGYLKRPELTQEKFVEDSFNESNSSKLYRTGDLGKMLPNNEILCLGRIDNQIKLRGHRIEAGEIETKLLELEDVKQCVVMARESTSGDKRLVAYLTLDKNAQDANNPTWKDRWDSLYSQGANENDASENFDLDNAALGQLGENVALKEQASEWLDVTLERIKKLNAKRIYEIGSGAGQLLYELAPQTDSYLATDYAQPAIDSINQRIAAEPEKWAQVKASVATADDFSATKSELYDLVLINSVTQYFSSSEYLLSVVTKAVNATSKGGCVFIGDVQGKSTLEMYHAMDHLPRASDTSTVESFIDIVKNRVEMEEELVADPTFFYELPSLIPNITAVDVQLRKGESINETTKYHYDVWLYVDKPIKIAAPQLSLSWTGTEKTHEVEQLMLKGDVEVIELRNIPNSRTCKDHRLQQLLATSSDEQLIAPIKKEIENTAEGQSPDLFWNIGEKAGYQTHVRWTTDGTDNLFDVFFIKAGATNTIPTYPTISLQKSLHDWVRNPVVHNEVFTAPEVITKWKENLQTSLPSYMMPEDFIVLKTFPLTPNAKIDRNALPQPKQRKTSIQKNERALTPDEQLIAYIWSETLGVKDLNANDDFFQLGGHSLLAVKAMVALENKTGKRLTIATLFEHSTVEKLANQLSEKDAVENTLADCDALVSIKTKGNKTPLFFIHGADLNILLFKEMSAFLDDDQPVYGLQALGISRPTDIPKSIEEIATRYIADMLKVNPNGPFAIAGYSLGGFIGFEIARQLQLINKEVKFLGIIDTFAGNYFEGDKFKKVNHELNKISFLAKSFIQRPKESLKYQVSVVKQKFKERFNENGHIPEDMFTSYEAEIYQKYSDALDAYKLMPTNINLTLFAVDNRPYYIADVFSMGWKKFALNGVSRREVPGDHTTVIYPPNNKTLAAAIQEVLNKELQKDS